MLYAFNQKKHPFSQWKCFTQVEPFEKLWFLIMFVMWDHNMQLNIYIYIYIHIRLEKFIL
jgi:hypothetical protein